eukprot:CAMPEP_0185275546 /NCGR_PEP_ID=MMETSP1359-20130426/54174_1 /TAXON_ID=552665 /ORGANISM="Bigelowiella longifila, Strain CCMP242" /LENGTH=32 /DNA_ID= /DNA_START= /DNA_END= /DNA_ORIENTATION=
MASKLWQVAEPSHAAPTLENAYTAASNRFPRK